MNKNLRKIKYFCVVLFMIVMSCTTVYATPYCEGYLSYEAGEMIKTVIKYVQICVPILLILLGAVDFGGAVISDDKDALKKAGAKFTKRCIAAVAIFFVPVFINLIFNLPGLSDTIRVVNDPMCGL